MYIIYKISLNIQTYLLFCVFYDILFKQSMLLSIFDSQRLLLLFAILGRYYCRVLVFLFGTFVQQRIVCHVFYYLFGH